MKKQYLLLMFLAGIFTATSQNAPIDFEASGNGAWFSKNTISSHRS